MLNFWRTLLKDDRGATAIEYGLMVAIIGISLLLSTRFLADELDAMWHQLASSVSTAG